MARPFDEPALVRQIRQSWRLMMLAELFYERRRFEEACAHKQRPLALQVSWEYMKQQLLDLDERSFRRHWRRLRRTRRSRTDLAQSFWAEVSMSTAEQAP